MPGIIDWLKDIVEEIRSIPEGIIDGFKTWWDSLFEWLDKIPKLILQGIIAIFVPDTEYIEESFTNFTEELKMKFSYDPDAFEGLFSAESPVEDVYVNYRVPGVGNFRLKVLDASFFVDGVTFFRPFIRGFLVLLMFLYHIKQIIGFFGYDAGVVTGRSDYIASEKKAQREEVA